MSSPIPERFFCEGGHPAETDGGPCEVETCQKCCVHDDMDHYICPSCEYEKCPGDDIDAAEYLFGGDR